MHGSTHSRYRPVGIKHAIRLKRRVATIVGFVCVATGGIGATAWNLWPIGPTATTSSSGPTSTPYISPETSTTLIPEPSSSVILISALGIVGIIAVMRKRI